jgi:hypothetical protein
MKEETQQSQKNTGNGGGGVFASMRKMACESKKYRNTPCARDKPRGGLENGLANLWRSKRITKKAHAGRREIKWEISTKS